MNSTSLLTMVPWKILTLTQIISRCLLSTLRNCITRSWRETSSSRMKVFALNARKKTSSTERASRLRTRLSRPCKRPLARWVLPWLYLRRTFPTSASAKSSVEVSRISMERSKVYRWTMRCRLTLTTTPNDHTPFLEPKTWK